MNERVRRWIEAVSLLDRRFIFVAIAVAVVAPLLVPIGLPLRTSREAQALYDRVESLPERAVVVLGFDYDPSSMPELAPMTRAILDHLFRKNLRVIALTNYAQTGPIAERQLVEIAARFGRRPGVDFVNLGYKAGNETVILAVANDFRSAYPVDHRGIPTDSLPVMAGVHTWKDASLLIDIAHGATTDQYVRIAGARFGLPVGAGCTAVSIPRYYSYLQSGQLVGLLGGLQGAAEYERFIRKPGFASAGMDAQSMAHLAILILVAAGNAAFFLSRRR
jgi:hypothetical protein